MDIMDNLYDSLLWIKDSEGNGTAYMHWEEIDRLDIFSWLDHQIFLAKKGNTENIAKYDSNGL